MRIFLLSAGLVIGLILLVSSEFAQSYIMTFVRLECQHLNYQYSSNLQEATQLSDSDALVFTRYSKISNIRLQNLGGQQLIRCEAYRFPKGVFVSVTKDGRTCEIFGVPTIPQARTNTYVLAVNYRGSSLAVVPMSVNALVLRE